MPLIKKIAQWIRNLICFVQKRRGLSSCKNHAENFKTVHTIFLSSNYIICLRMSCHFDPNKHCFSFIWILENFEYCREKTGQYLRSPTFIVDTIERTKWSLTIFPRGKESDDWISLYLFREPDSKGPATIDVAYELAILATDGSILQSEEIHKCTFPKGPGHGFFEFQKRNVVFAKPSMFLHQGWLRIRCRIWTTTGDVKKDIECIARTKICVERKAFFWKIKKFSTLAVRQEKTFRIKSPSDDKPVMTLNLFLRENGGSIFIKFHQSNKNVIFSTFKSSLISGQGDCVTCGQKEFWFSPSVQSDECMLCFSKDSLLKNINFYVPNDILTLYCEQVFSTGTACEGIENSIYGCCGYSTSSNVDLEHEKTASIETFNLNTDPDLKMDLGTMLHDNILCDVMLRTESEIFHAHWFILSARSPVFRAMFKSDMKEKAKDRIDIKDLKPNTVRNMLHYMYTDSLEELQWDTASDLYIAAEKYQIMTLKHKCSAFLKTNLGLTNACEILLLADLHVDKELKSTVQKFILENDKIIFNSREWKLLMKDNLELAAETMVLRFQN